MNPQCIFFSDKQVLLWINFHKYFICIAKCSNLNFIQNTSKMLFQGTIKYNTKYVLKNSFVFFACVNNISKKKGWKCIKNRMKKILISKNVGMVLDVKNWFVQIHTVMLPAKKISKMFFFSIFMPFRLFFFGWWQMERSKYAKNVLFFLLSKNFMFFSSKIQKKGILVD